MRVREQVWRTQLTREQREGLLRPSLAALPAAYGRAASYHVGVHPALPPLPLLRELRAIADGPPGASEGTLPPGGDQTRFNSRQGWCRHTCIRSMTDIIFHFV